MILSVSRRTDIPDYYSDWFLNRIKEGYLCVRNPFNEHQVSRIDLSPDVVDCIVFWTKNPANMLERLEELRDYQFYFQFTLTGYGKDIEPRLPDKRGELIRTFRKLSEKTGKDRVIWRYDPVFISSKYSASWHLKTFDEFAAGLAGYTSKVVISFMDFYAKTQRNMAGLNIGQMTDEQMIEMAGKLVRIADKYQMEIESCAEQIDLASAGVRHGSCIDKKLIEKIIGCRLTVEKDKNQRKECGCFESIEVGSYNTCLNGCKYCYANYSNEKVQQYRKRYDVNSPLLCGSIGADDNVTDRKVRSCKDPQISFWN